MTQNYNKKVEAFLKSRDVDVKSLSTKKQVKEANNFVAACRPEQKKSFDK